MCAKHAPSTSRTSLLKVLEYQYKPSPIETSTRLTWLQSKSARILKHAKPHLPQELRLQIARYLLQGTALHRCAVAYTHTLPKNIESSSSRIRLSAEIWARFIKFEGIQYISSLANSRDDYHTTCVFTPDPAQLADCILIGENYLGVMQILFCSSVHIPAVERHHGLWWRIIRLRGGKTVLDIRTDVGTVTVTVNKTNKS